MEERKQVPIGVTILGPQTAEVKQVLTSDALQFLATLHRKFNFKRQKLLQARNDRALRLQEGKEVFDFLPTTKGIRENPHWHVAPAPKDLEKRWVEITGPTDRKMIINALNSGANVFMADFEDALTPRWDKLIAGQLNLMDAVRRRIEYTSPQGKQYKVNPQSTTTLLVRPRGWHLNERFLLIDGQPISGSLFDFGLYFFHNAKELIKRGTGPYFYLPKMESHLEARLWNNVFNFAQDYIGIPRGTIRATVLIETLPAAFEMEEILYELRDHAAGLNAGRWDYIFSAIKKLYWDPKHILPDRATVTMTVPFMRAYTNLMIATCHTRGAHAIGGMAAFIPGGGSNDQVIFDKVRADKEREADDGCDGTWVAHPGLVQLVTEIFANKLNGKPHQKDKLRSDVRVTAQMLRDVAVPGCKITEAGFRLNINVALQYLNSWLSGNAAAAIHGLMEDTATAEISRAQIWQWIRHGVQTDDGKIITRELYKKIRDEEYQKLTHNSKEKGKWESALEILDKLILNDEFVEFLTFISNEYLIDGVIKANL
jgi:malate synthase